MPDASILKPTNLIMAENKQEEITEEIPNEMVFQNKETQDETQVEANRWMTTKSWQPKVNT
jgi:hypothetical protein